MKKNQTSKTMMEMPPSDDEYFLDGDKFQINKDELENIICDECEFVVYPERREIECAVCGRGFKFLTHQATETEQGILIEVNGKTCAFNSIESKLPPKI